MGDDERVNGILGGGFVVNKPAGSILVLLDVTCLGTENMAARMSRLQTIQRLAETV